MEMDVQRQAPQMSGYERQSLAAQQGTRKAAIFVAWVVGIWIAVSVIAGIFIGIRVAAATSSGSGVTACASLGGTDTSC